MTASSTLFLSFIYFELVPLDMITFAIAPAAGDGDGGGLIHTKVIGGAIEIP